MKPVTFHNSFLYNLNKIRRRAVRSYALRVQLFKYIPCFFLFAGLGGFKGLISAAAYWVIYTMIFDHRIIKCFKPSINIWFGVPGSGKTSMAAWLTKASSDLGYIVLSNVEIKGAYKLEPEDLGKYDMSFGGAGCHVIYDEGSLDFDNRQHKSFANSTKPLYFALHRHMNNRVDVFSQGYDIDKRIRDRAGSNGLFYLKRFPIPGIIMYRRISKVLFIKKDDKQMIDGFEFKGLPRFCWTRSVWKSFDTLDMSMCPKEQKVWSKW